MDLPKVYDSKDVEKKWYRFWEEQNFFVPKLTPDKKPFTIVIPPPNVTGSLHIGHALNNTLQDILIRFHRMKGNPTLWLPGTDHAGIATQNVVEKEINREGKKKGDLGREEFLKRVWTWKEKYGNNIIEQLKRLGASADWQRLRFTMDENLSRAVRKEFVILYRDGLIYRGKRIINWCPRCQTALSDIEVEHETLAGKLWYIKYPLSPHPHPLSQPLDFARDKRERGERGEGYITVATTRPETMLGDTAVAVNPHDERYKRLIGKILLLPLVNRKIPVIKDDFVDPEFGTGAVKVTPAHDPNDFEMGLRHNLPQINILYPDGRISLDEFENSEKELTSAYHGKDRYKVRDLIVEDLKSNGFLDKIEDYQTAIGKCYRCKTTIEPYLSDQWFVKMKDLAAPAIRAVETGKIKFVPERWTKVYLDWMTGLRDWCISRQIWWGHRIPVWYCLDGHLTVSETEPLQCETCQKGELKQDEDVLDTWFSSALWPFSTLGWPDQTEDLKTFYPTSVLVTSYDIITFWVSRMIMTGLRFMKEKPFETVYIHALVRDYHGKKMIKSLGNVIDPVPVIDQYGADALRFALTSLVTLTGQDLKLSEDKIIENRNFANKIWNVARFVITTSPPSPLHFVERGEKPIPSVEVARGEVRGEVADRWILSRYNQTVKEVTTLIENFDFGEAARSLYAFIWGEFCDWYVEIAKIRLYHSQSAEEKETAQRVLIQVLEGTLRLLHPFMPFITEEIWQRVTSHQLAPNEVEGALGTSRKSIMVSQWPQVEERYIDPEVESRMERIMEVTRAIRNIRREMNVPPGKVAEAIIVSTRESTRSSVNEGIPYLKTLAKLSIVDIKERLPQKPPQSAFAAVADLEIYVPLAGLIDIAKEKERLQKEIEKIETELKTVRARLSSEQFLKKAKPEAVEKEKEREREGEARQQAILAQLQGLT